MAVADLVSRRPGHAVPPHFPQLCGRVPLALLLIEESGLAGGFFIPAGITVAFLLRVPRNSWWLVLAAAATAEASMDLLAGIGLGQTAGFVAANTLEPVVGALIVTRMCGTVDVARLRHVFWFLTGAVLSVRSWVSGVGAAADRLLGGDELRDDLLAVVAG